MRLVHALVVLLVTGSFAVPGAPAASDATTTEHFAGTLSGAGFGLHITKHATWRGVHHFDIEPGVVAVDLFLTGTDHALDGSNTVTKEVGSAVFGEDVVGVNDDTDFWMTFVGPDGEGVVGTSGGSAPTRALRIDWPTIDRLGFGSYAAVVTCGFCATLSYELDVVRTWDDVGGNVTLAERHVLANPGETTTILGFVTNTGAAPAAFVLDAADEEKKWDTQLSDVGTVLPGQSAPIEIRVTPKHNTKDGTHHAFDVVLRDLDGNEHDRVRVDAAVDSALAQERARSNVVIALIDTGINPYHEDFRGPTSSLQHPAWFVESYPDDAQALPLTLDADDYAAAKSVDSPVWDAARGDTLYYVPGTRIIGTICFGSCKPLDEGGHGTGTASLAAGATLGEAPEALIVAVNGDFFKGARWAARQPWIDVISMSLGPYLGTGTVGICDPVCTGTGNPYVPFSIPFAQKTAYESGKRFFTGSSQGFGAGVNTSPATGSWTGASAGCPYIWSSSFAGSPWTFAIETYWPWTELPWRTSCYPPDIVAQGWDLVAASAQSYAGTNGFGHASGATPQAAGAYARVIHEARRVFGSTQEGAIETPSLLNDVSAHLGEHVLAVAAPGANLPPSGPLADGVLTVAEAENMFLTGLEQVDVVTSFERHGSDPRWQDDAMPVAPGDEYAQEGWGLLTDLARANMLDVAQGKAEPAFRPDDRAQYEAQFAFRLAFWEAHVENEIWVF